MKTSELKGAALDWAVAKCEGTPEYLLDKPWRASELLEHYSTDWAQGGPIIEREGISVASDTSGVFEGFVWFASYDSILTDAEDAVGVRGPTPLIAAMRCYIASKLGDTVEIPNELANG